MHQEVKVVTKNNLNIRYGPGTSNKIVGSLTPGSIVSVNGIMDVGNQTWYDLEDGRGWICGYNPGGGGNGVYLELVRDLENLPVTQPSPSPSETTTGTTDNNTTGTSLGLDQTIISMLYNQQSSISKKISASTRLFGCPFQFTKQTDFRINDLDLGRKYLENIVAESPIVFFTPGKPNYLPNVSTEQKDALNNFFTSMQTNDSTSRNILNDITGSDDIRYFDFINDFAEYMRYVNLLCRMCAIYLGIENKKAFGTNTTYKYFDWTDYKYKNGYISKNTDGSTKSVFSLDSVSDDAYELMFGNFNYIQFYVEPSTSFSESMGASTTSSKLQSMFETGEGLMKELSFLTNTAALRNVDEATKSFGASMEEISKRMSNNGEGFFTRLLGMSSAVLKGSNVLFPEIWQDSNYNKSYNVTVNLVSPYGDKESLYLNILVPLMHILSLGLPRQSSANSFAHPFLVKAFSKGWFSCEMGIIDSIQIDKGGSGDAWTVDGLPSEMKVTIGIKDLYSNLMITPTTKPTLFFENQGMIDFLAVMCGIDLTKPNFLIKLESMFSVFFGKVINLPKEAYADIIQNLRQKVQPLIRM